MEEKIKLLIKLQECDNRISKIRKKMEESPLKIKELEQELEGFEGDVQESLERLEDLKKERREVERGIDDLENKKQKSQVKLSSISSNKEYRAALKEIDDIDQEKSRLEDRAIELMEEMDRLEAECKDKKKELEARKSEFEKSKKAVEKELKTLETELKGLENERKGFCSEIEEQLLKKYDLLRSKKGGLAISAVVSGVCQTCHMGIPPQKFNELIRGDELMSCPNCNRIIYWGDNERFKKIIENKE